VTNQHICLADGGKHRWTYHYPDDGGKFRECDKCGVLQRQHGNRYVQVAK
jgi:hypothetical protein